MLVADDIEVNRMIVKQMLSKIQPSWSSEEADTAEAAVAMATANNYDLIVMDQHFGDEDKMTGTEATAMIREAGVTALIIGLTGDSSEGHDEKAKEAGQDWVLSKPFYNPPKLARLINRLRRQSSTRESS